MVEDPTIVRSATSHSSLNGARTFTHGQSQIRAIRI